MLSTIEIQNYKSIEKLELAPGRVNLLIGENGCGKSNILEAIAIAAAAESLKLDNEFLSNRGIRVTNPTLMRACFHTKNETKPIAITVSFSGFSKRLIYELENDNQPYSKWQYVVEEEKIVAMLAALAKNVKTDTQVIDFLSKVDTSVMSPSLQKRADMLRNFLIFSPEKTALRNFYKEGQIEPLGINGEGLLKLLKVINNTNPEQITIITDALQLFGWYKSIEIPSNINQHDNKIKIIDRYITKPFDQRSANEGFLFVLFYITLMVSDNTPKIFAIDNIDASLNPKLCTKLIEIIAQLAEKFDKQVFLTTHNPAILDGLNLADDNQKLFVISRKKTGSTAAKEMTADNLSVSSTDKPIRLSEAFLRGDLGALPKNFGTNHTG